MSVLTLSRRLRPKPSLTSNPSLFARHQMNPQDVAEKADVASQQADVAMNVIDSAAYATRASASASAASAATAGKASQGI